MVLIKKNILLMLICLVGIIPLTGLMAEDSSGDIAEKKIQELASPDFAEAYRLYTDEKYPEAIRLFKSILHDPKEKSYHDLAQLYIIRSNVLSGNHLMLESDCNRFLGRYPDSIYTAEVIYVLGRYYFSVNAFDKTVREYSLFLNKNKDRDFDFKIPLTFWLGEAYLKLGKENQASTSYLYVISEAPIEDPVGWRAAAEARMAELAKKHQIEPEPEEIVKEDPDEIREKVVGDDTDLGQSPVIPEVEEPEPAEELAKEETPSPGIDAEPGDTIAALPEDLPNLQEEPEEEPEKIPEEEVVKAPEKTPEISPDVAEVEKLKKELEKVQKENENIKEMVKMKERLMDLKLYYMEQRVKK